ncbi:MAG: hypothetical protein IJD78_07755 [Clostridia bacterium]|nr:hypothetical protein [Clostridia bacterium]MBQ3007439.1 hypothetical protein [Clostridia bacterium]
MKINDDDIKIFHPKKTEAAGADLAELALLVDFYRSNGNTLKATELGDRLADLAPETFCPEDAAKLTTNEVRQLRALMLFAAQIALHKYLPHAMLSSQAINSMYSRLSETAAGFFSNISDGSSFTFYYLTVRKNRDVVENIGKNYAMLCDKDDDEYLISLGSRIFSQVDVYICDLIEKAEFAE